MSGLGVAECLGEEEGTGVCVVKVVVVRLYTRICEGVRLFSKLFKGVNVYERLYNGAVVYMRMNIHDFT